MIQTILGVMKQSLSFISPVTQIMRESLIKPLAAVLNAEAWFVTLLISVVIASLMTRTRLLRVNGWLKLMLISAVIFLLLWVI